MILSALPGWLPWDVTTVFLVVFIIAVLAMNKGEWWIVNVLAAREEPLIVALGVTVAIASGDVASLVGNGSPDAWLVVGVFTALLGVVMWRSEGFDVPSLR